MINAGSASSAHLPWWQAVLPADRRHELQCMPKQTETRKETLHAM
jgi:hypothetical protein